LGNRSHLVWGRGGVGGGWDVSPRKRKRSPFLPAACFLSSFWGSASASAGGSGSGLCGRGWQPGSQKARTLEQGRGAPASAFRFVGLSTRGRLSSQQDFGTPDPPPPPLPPWPNSRNFSPAFLDGSSFPSGAGLPPLSGLPFVGQVRSASLSGRGSLWGPPSLRALCGRGAALEGLG
jgi:hypothetical protein